MLREAKVSLFLGCLGHTFLHFDNLGLTEVLQTVPGRGTASIPHLLSRRRLPTARWPAKERDDRYWRHVRIQLRFHLID